jgi:hypothetical protein
MPGFDNDTAFASLLTLDGDGAGAQNMIDLVPDTAIGGVAWNAINIDGGALDPTALNSTIYALSIDLSGVAQTNSPEQRGLNVTMAATSTGEGCDSALHATGFGITSLVICNQRDAGFYTDGVIRQDADITAFTAVDSGSSYLLNVNNAGSTGGDFHALEVSLTGAGTATVNAVGTNPDVGVIHQHTGTFAATAQSWKENGGFTDVTAAFDNPGVDVTIFDADNDYIYIGSNAVFSQIRVILNTPSGRNIFPTFEYSVVGPAWTAFTPIDATNGFTQNGIIEFDSASLAGWVAVVVNGANHFYIRIRRTRNNIITTPIEDTIRILQPTTYYWNDAGDILSSSMTAVGGTFTTCDAGTFDTNVAAAGVTLSGVTLAADGTDANINIPITPKGTGVLQTANIGNAADTTHIAIQTTGEINYPLQPYVCAYPSANILNVTGNGTTYDPVVFNTEIVDQNNDFVNGTFTAPVTGQYIVVFKLLLLALGGATQIVTYINTSNRFFYMEDFNPTGMSTAGLLGCLGSAIVEADAADTITIRVIVFGVGADTVDIRGTETFSFVNVSLLV